MSRKYLIFATIVLALAAAHAEEGPKVTHKVRAPLPRALTMLSKVFFRRRFASRSADARGARADGRLPASRRPRGVYHITSRG